MIAYREQSRTGSTDALLGRLRECGTVRDLLIAYGELESALSDALAPECDRIDATTRAMRAAAIETGRSLSTGDMDAALRAVDRLRDLQLPDTVRVSVPEGYAYYALYPEAYVEAARRFYANEHPARVVVIGIRSIGASLSAAVAGTLLALGCETHSCTVRPRGHPFQRQVAATPQLEAELRSQGSSWFAVVDEGPGLSGSSFASVAGWLSGLGIPDDRIVLFPSWEPDGSRLLSEAARTQWRRHRKFSVAFEEVWKPPLPGLADLSGGAWRRLLFPNRAQYPAVNPQHERRKYLGRERVLLKFQGLGRYGRDRLELATQLAQAGFSPAVEGFHDGFLATRFEDGRPLAAGQIGSGFIEAAAQYLAFRKQSFAARPGASFDELSDMIRVNAREASLGAVEGLEQFRNSVVDAGAVAIDGRMLPHEWIETAHGYLKTDAVDHHDDHFFPGDQDIAWDLAGCAIEFDLSPSAEEHLLATYARVSRDTGIRRRLPFYRVAYAASRLGYTTICAGAVGDEEEVARFTPLVERYKGVFTRAAVCCKLLRNKPV